MTAVVDQFNHVTLNFSQPVKPSLILSDLDLSLSDTDSNHYNFSAQLSEIHTNQSFNISLEILSSHLPRDNEFNIAFIHPEMFTDKLGNHLQVFQISVQLHPIGVSDLASNTTYRAHVSTATSAATSISTAACIAFSLLSSDPVSLFSLINNIQMITYFPLSTVPLPERLKSHMVSMNLQSYFSNPLTLSVEMKREVEVTPPKFAANYGFSDASFVVNAGVILISYAINVGLLPIIWMLSRCKKPSIANYFREMLGGYKWRNLMLHWIEIYLDLSIACFLQLRVVISKQLSFDSAALGINSLLAFLFSLLCCILPFLLLYLSIKHYSVPPNDTSLHSWHFLFAGFKNSQGWIHSAYYIFFISRRLLYSSTLVFLDGQPVAQSVLCAGHSIAVNANQTATYLLLYRPFSDKLPALTVTLSEVSMALLFSLVIAFNFDIGSRVVGKLETVSVVFIYAAIATPTITGFVSLLLKLKTTFQQFAQAKYALTNYREAVASRNFLTLSSTRQADSQRFSVVNTGQTIPSVNIPIR